jgi:hypothetical protein|tara:strand:+ start:3537 stop:4376 length:840 start_codon:yes stop_codon:yes gene_type:complete
MRNSQRSFIFVLFLLISFVSKAGSDSLFTFWNIKENNKGKMYLYWGYNRAAYSNSDIKFKGRDYDFEIFDVRATDRQTKFDWNLYFHPAKLTIPQTNLKFGYFFSDKYSFSVGVDHMKYVMDNTQSAKITGTVPDSVFSGTYTNDDIKLDESFLDYEHTDGLNYLNIELNRFDGLIDFKNIISLQSIVGLGVAALMPKTNAILFGRGRYDEFHLAGFGINVKTGLNLRIGKYFFIQTEGKAGYINMPDIRPTKFSDEKASQSFTFLEYTILFGINVKVK